MRKYPVPTFLAYKIDQTHYDRWLSRKAASLSRRDRKGGNSLALKAAYKVAIHEAVCRSEGKDAYTGEELEWEKAGTYSNEASRNGRGRYKTEFALLPTVDHVDGRNGLPNFNICSWRTNDAKNDLSVTDFVELCRRVVAHNQ